MAAAVARFAHAFRDAISDAAESVGKGDQLESAMQLWGKAKSWQRFGTDLLAGMKKAAPWAAGSAIGTPVGFYAVKQLRDMLGFGF